MARKVRLNAKVDAKLYSDFQNIVKELGLTTTAAFRIFMLKTIKEKGIPFDLKFNNSFQDKRSDKF